MTPISNEIRQVGKNGMWTQNAIMVQLLGLCPMIAVSTSLINAFSLGLVTILVMGLSSAIAASLRGLIFYEIRVPVFILIIAVLVTVLDLTFNVYLHQLYAVLGIFIPLIVTNCIVLARVEAFAVKNGPFLAAWDGVAMGLGLLWVITLLGAVRELAGYGTLFSGIELLFPSLQAIHLFPKSYPNFLLAILPPGAFLFLGVIIAARNWLNQRAISHNSPSQTVQALHAPLK